MRYVRWHEHNRVVASSDLDATDGEGERSGYRQHQGIEGSRMLRHLLSSIESEKSDVPRGSPRQDSTRNALSCRRDE